MKLKSFYLEARMEFDLFSEHRLRHQHQMYAPDSKHLHNNE